MLPRPINVTLINAAVGGDKEQHVRTGIYHGPMKEGTIFTKNNNKKMQDK